MTYATVEDFKARVSERLVAQLASDDGQTVDDVLIAQALADASAIVDGYIARVTEQHRPVAGVLQPYAVDIALFRLAQRRPGLDVDNIKAGHDDAVRFLERVAAGRLGGGAPGAVTTTGIGPIGHAGPEPIMTRDSLGDL